MPTLQLKALNKHSITHNIHQMEILSAIKKLKKLTHNADKGVKDAHTHTHVHIKHTDIRQ